MIIPKECINCKLTLEKIDGCKDCLRVKAGLPKEMVRETEQILFSDRLRMQQEFYNWCKRTKADIHPMNVIAWLQMKYDFVRKE